MLGRKDPEAGNEKGVMLFFLQERTLKYAYTTCLLLSSRLLYNAAYLH